MTAEEFWDFCGRSENDDRHWELEDGQPVEMPLQGVRHGTVCAWVVHLLWEYAAGRRRGYGCSNNTGLLMARDPDTVYCPDVMFFENRRLEDMSPTFATEVPQLVIEVLSDTDSAHRMRHRVGRFLVFGVPLVWLIEPEDRTVSVYRPEAGVQVVDGSGELAGVLAPPDFRCRVTDFFTLPGR
jgi:Uma2 family endonuclease